LLLTGGIGYNPILWDLVAQAPRHTLDHRGFISVSAFSPTGDTMWTGSPEEGIKHWRTETGKLIHQIPARSSRLIALHAQDDDTITWLESDADNTSMYRWSEAEGSQQIWQQPGRIDAAVFRAAKLPGLEEGGVRVLTAEWNEFAKLRDARTGEQVGPLLNHNGLRIHGLAFSSDGSMLLTGGRDKAARLWDAVTGKPLGPPMLHRDYVVAVAFSPDGRKIATAGEAHVARLWDVPVPLRGTAESIRFAIEAQTGMELDEQGAVRELDASARQQRRRRAEDARGREGG
jgi:WD40 repeat protein